MRSPHPRWSPSASPSVARKSHARAAVAILGFLSLRAATGTVHADDAVRGDVTAANALFVEGKQLSASGRFGDACAKFEASMGLVPRLGVQLNLADCYEHVGKTASAWWLFGEAAELAARIADKREGWARQRQQALLPRLSRLAISILPSPSGEVGGLVVLRDGARVSPASYGVAVPVDPGEHRVEATAPGCRPWSTRVAIPGDAGVVAIDVPALLPRPELVSVPAAPGRRRPTTVTWIATGIGIAGIGAGAILGLSARSLWTQARPGCDASNACSDEAAARIERGRRDGNLSTAAFAIGGSALATGIVLYLSSPREQRAVRLVPAAAGAALAGVF